MSGPDLDQSHTSLFVLRLGHALHKSGYAAHSLEEILQKVCDRLGIVGQFFTTPTAIMASFGPLDHQQTHLIRVQPGELNLGRLSALDDVVQAVLDGTQTPQEGSARIDKILTKKPTYPWWLRVFGYGIVSAAGCQFLGGAYDDVVVSASVGLLIGLIALAFKRFTITSHVFELTASFVASALVTFVAAQGLHISIPTSDARRHHHAAARADHHRRDDGAGEPAPLVGQRAPQLRLHRVCRDDLWRRAGHDRGHRDLRRPRAQLRARASAASGRSLRRWRWRRLASRCCCARVRGTSRWCAGQAGLDTWGFSWAPSTWGRFWARRWGRSPSGS